MRLAIWDTPLADLWVSGLDAGPLSVPLGVERHDAHTCTQLLQRGKVDVALLPSVVVLSNTDTFDVLPGAALSTWKNPYVRLVFHKDLAQVESVVFGAAHTQEALITQILLKEHYGKEPGFVPLVKASVDTLLNAPQDASLIVGSDAPLLQTTDLMLDVGQEWYELANYPMVWGLFATLKEEAAPVMVEVVTHAARAAEQQRALWTRAREMPPLLHAFYHEDLRFRLDDLALAGLTELRHYLYYYNITDEISELPLYVLPEDWQDDEDEIPLV